jgi:hypothetical protein
VSVTAIGPATTLDGPLPREPRYSLLSVPGVLVSEGDGDFLNGVNLWGYPSSVPSLWDPCSTGTNRTKEDESEIPLARFDPFGAYLPIVCSALGLPDGFEDRAEAALRATLSFAVEQSLSEGFPGSTNPNFTDSDLVILPAAPGTAQTPETGLALLEEAIGATGREGIIHATPAIASAWGFDKLETRDGLRTANGTPVAVGGGYIGADPALGTSPIANDTGWAFATGPVEVRLSEFQMLPDDISEALDRSINEVVYRAERYVLATWDTALQAGVLINWTP